MEESLSFGSESNWNRVIQTGTGLKWVEGYTTPEQVCFIQNSKSRTNQDTSNVLPETAEAL